MAKKLTKGKREYLHQCVRNLCEWRGPFWQLGSGWSSIDATKLDSARREAFMVRQNRAYMAIYC